MQSMVLDIIKVSECRKSALEERGKGNPASVRVAPQGIKQEAKSGL